MKILTTEKLTAEQWELQKLGTNSKAQAILQTALQKIILDNAILSTVSEAIIDKYYDFYFSFLYESGEVGDRRWLGALSTLMLKNENLIANYAKWQGLANDTGNFSESWSGTDTEVQKNFPKVSTKTFTDNIIRQTQTRYRGVSDTDSQTLADLVIDSPTKDNNTQVEEVRTEDEGDDTKTMTKGTKRTYSDGRTAAALLAENAAVNSPLVEFINLFGQILVDPFYIDELPTLWGICEC